MCKHDKSTTKYHIQESKEVSLFQEMTRRLYANRHYRRQKQTQILTKKSTKLALPRKNIGGLKLVSQYWLTLNAYVDQDT